MIAANVAQLTVYTVERRSPPIMLGIASGSSTTQVRSLAEEVEFQLEQQGVRPLRTEGYDSKNWILLDYGEVIVHVFYPQAREFYDLEHLWADADPVEVQLDAEAK